MYPNFTHAWLMYNNECIIQTVPGSFISIAKMEAGRQRFCGFIRHHVADFLPEQLEVLRGIIESPTFIGSGSHDVTVIGYPISTETDHIAPFE